MSKTQKMSKKEMRIAIAEDLLKQLRKRKTMAVTQGIYCDVVDLDTLCLDNNLNRGDSAQPHIDKIQGSCTVCALGGMLLSHIRLFNKVDIGQLTHVGGYDIKGYLLDYFSKTQLSLIEGVFERWHGGDKAAACAFARKYRGDKQRLIAIMKNIVKNEGIFKP